MSSPIFDSTFGTGRFMREEPMTTDQSQSNAEPKQDVREALELQLFDLVELARDTRSDKGGEAKWVHPRGALVKEFAKRIAALAQSDAGPLRCLITGNPCGTDTWGKNSPCRCINCQMWLTRSDAEPVAWQYRIKQGGWGGWHEAAPTKAEALSCIEAQQRLGLVDEYELRPLYTAPSLPDASGLIEALERISKSDVYDMDTLHPDRCASVAAEALKAFRAADRSVHGELIPECPTEGVAARQGNGG